MSGQNGKGSDRRPSLVSMEEYNKNYDRIYKKKGKKDGPKKPKDK